MRQFLLCIHPLSWSQILPLHRYLLLHHVVVTMHRLKLSRVHLAAKWINSPDHLLNLRLQLPCIKRLLQLLGSFWNRRLVQMVCFYGRVILITQDKAIVVTWVAVVYRRAIVNEVDLVGIDYDLWLALCCLPHRLILFLQRGSVWFLLVGLCYLVDHDRTGFMRYLIWVFQGILMNFKRRLGFNLRFLLDWRFILHFLNGGRGASLQTRLLVNHLFHADWLFFLWIF
jgi:hypothetical protein